MAKAKRKTEAPAANSPRQESKNATDLISAADVSLIGRCGRTITQAKDMRSVVAETLKIIRRLTPAKELRVVYRSRSEWKEWYATGRRIREFEHSEWPTPSPAAQTVSFDNLGHQYGFVSTSPASEEHGWMLELIAPQIAAALTMHAAIRRAQKNAVSEKALVRETLRARDEERRRITHELHDDVGQTIATLKLKLKLLENQMKRDGNAAKAIEELAEAREGVGSLLSKIRDLSHTLYPRILDTLGFIPALEELAGQVSSSSEVDLRCKVHGEPRPLKESPAVALYRCCQEAISNSIKHSGASNVAIRVCFSDAEIRVVVEDNGRGFDPRRFYDSSGKLMSSGFWTIRQRMSDVGGSFRIGTASGKGTSIEMIIPLPTGEE